MDSWYKQDLEAYRQKWPENDGVLAAREIVCRAGFHIKEVQGLGLKALQELADEFIAAQEAPCD